MTPIKLLVKRLSRRWNAEDALVVADWCEEHELTQFAWGIRRGVIDTLDHHVRTEVNRLAWAMGVRAHDVDELDWRRPDHKRVLRTLGCCGLEWRSRALSRSVTRPPRNPTLFEPLRRCTRPAGHRGDHEFDPKVGRSATATASRAR